MITNVFSFIKNNQKYLPVTFFVAGFIWDTLTLDRIDQLFDRIILTTYLVTLSLCLYMYNVVDDGKWKKTFLEKFENYLPLAIQFFLGGLCSAYVIYFSRSVSFTKTLLFFVILVILLFANEMLQRRISNKYMQFSAYFFTNFIFFTVSIPVLVKQMNTMIFIISGLVSLITTLSLIVYIYKASPSTRVEISKRKMVGIILGIYIMINTFYYFNLIPPVPLALDTAVVAHDVQRINGDYIVTYEQEVWYKFWRKNSYIYTQEPGTNVYVFASIFAPTALNKSVAHRWKWKNPQTNRWDTVDQITYDIVGGRNKGYRGFTFKRNIQEGLWRVDVITEEGSILGTIRFEVIMGSINSETDLTTDLF